SCRSRDCWAGSPTRCGLDERPCMDTRLGCSPQAKSRSDDGGIVRTRRKLSTFLRVPGSDRTRDYLGAGLGRAAGWLARMSHWGSGSSLPGMIAEAVSPGFILRRARLYADVACAAGTNVRLSTSSMSVAILSVLAMLP